MKPIVTILALLAVFVASTEAAWSKNHHNNWGWRHDNGRHNGWFKNRNRGCYTGYNNGWNNNNWNRRNNNNNWNRYRANINSRYWR